ncbi:MAG TPA: GNAT family N-acetyltransferase [Acidimicrobiales bacterium]|nr:GNAT family N-acetyltransferase [Acidimicrobiales bacterium]
MTVSIVEANEVTPALVDAFVRLVPQLSKSNLPPSEAELAEMVESPATVVFMALDDETAAFVGTLTLALFRIPTGLRAWIEDVIVDEAARGDAMQTADGQRVGVALTMAAIDRSRALGAKTVDLTSRPSRVAANKIYQRIGFTERETNVYRFTLE